MKLKNTLDLKILKEKKLINKKFLKLKILGTGEIKKILKFLHIMLSNKLYQKLKKQVEK